MPRDNNEAYEPARNAQRYGMRVNPDTGRVMYLLSRLGENEITYGKPYCPCLPQHTEDTLCPCRYMRKYQVCRCGLYLKDDDNRKDDPHV